MPRQIFRKEALDRLASPEQLDQLMQLTSPRGWIALAGLGLLLLAALVWGLVGWIPTTVKVDGFLLPSLITATHSGKVAEVLVQVGQDIEDGQVLFKLDQGPALVSRSSGRVAAIDVKKGDPVKEGTPLLRLEQLEAVLYVPVGEGYQIEEKQKAEVWPASVKRGEHGALRGEVIQAPKIPVGHAEMLARLQNEDLVNSLQGNGPFLEVVVSLSSKERPWEYQWSGSRGKNPILYADTPCQGQIEISKEHPIVLVFPILHNRGGS
jgi:hypothetical protein